MGNVGFCRRFIKDFSTVAKLLYNLLEKNITFVFDEDCLKDFETIREKLVTFFVMIVPDRSQPFEVMCDDYDYVVGAVLGERCEKVFRAIHYARKALNGARLNYTIAKEDMLAVVFLLVISSGDHAVI